MTEEELPAEPEDPTKIEQISAEDFVQQAQEPQMAYQIDQILKTIRDRTGASYRQIARGYALVLRTIATTMPWDEESGLDARRFHLPSKSVLPSWRDCIGACLDLTFTKPESPPEATSNEDDSPLEADNDPVEQPNE